MTSDMEDPRVIIIGAGIAGIIAAVSLKDDLKLDNFVIYERASELGGVWRDSVYPGLTCDIPTHWYSYSRHLKPDWSAHYATQAELQQYWLDVADKFGIRKYIQFNTEFVGAQWVESEQAYRYHIETNGRQEEKTAAVIITACGSFRVPMLPRFEGLAQFQGPYFHSAHWNKEVSLSNKRVAVVGSGASGVQIVPAIAKDPTTTVINFCRSPVWILPRPNPDFSSLTKWVFTNVPGSLRFYRAYLMITCDVRYIVWKSFMWPLRKYAEKKSLAYMQKVAPEKYQAVLIPNHTLGCKRLQLDPGYLESLHLPNVALQRSGIRNFEKDAIIASNGEKIRVDVVVFATGYEIDDGNIPITGRNGLTLRKYYETLEGSRYAAYLGVNVPHYPNVFQLNGPNTATGHASVIFGLEAQMDYIVKLLKPILDRQVQSFDVKEDVSADYNKKLTVMRSDTIVPNCQTLYGTDDRILTLFPGTLSLYWWWTRSPKWENYDIVDGGGQWLRKVKAQRRNKKLGGLAIVLVVALTSFLTIDIFLNKVHNYIT